MSHGKLLEHVSESFDNEIINEAAISIRSKVLSYIDKMYEAVAVIGATLDPRIKVDNLPEETKNHALVQLNDLIEDEEVGEFKNLSEVERDGRQNFAHSGHQCGNREDFLIIGRFGCP